jgi:hypothetical protein
MSLIGHCKRVDFDSSPWKYEPHNLHQRARGPRAVAEELIAGSPNRAQVSEVGKKVCQPDDIAWLRATCAQRAGQVGEDLACLDENVIGVDDCARVVHRS